MRSHVFVLVTFTPFFYAIACTPSLGGDVPTADISSAESYWPLETPSPSPIGPTATTTSPPIKLILYTPTTLPIASDESSTLQPTLVAEIQNIDCLQLTFEADVTIPDGSVLDSNQEFRKTWRLRNQGTCSLPPGFELVYVSGNLPYQPEAKSVLAQPVPPGATFEVTIELVAPIAPGTYRADFQLRSPSGEILGLGSEATGSIFTDFTVGPSVDFKLSLEEFHLCSMHYMTVRVENSGDAPLRSLSFKAIDHETGKTLVDRHIDTTPFTPTPKACPPGAMDSLPGQILYLSFNIGDPRSKHNATLFLNICSEESQQGTCIEKELSFLTP